MTLGYIYIDGGQQVEVCYKPVSVAFIDKVSMLEKLMEKKNMQWFVVLFKNKNSRGWFNKLRRKLIYNGWVQILRNE